MWLENVYALLSKAAGCRAVFNYVEKDSHIQRFHSSDRSNCAGVQQAWAAADMDQP